MAIKNRPTQLNGINPLAYVGVNPYTPPGMYQLPRNPTVRDNAGFQIGDYWMNQNTNDLWYLAQKSTPGAVAPANYSDALWVLLGKGPSIRTLTGDVGGPVGPDVNGNIDTLGTAGEILVTGTPGTNTLTWSLPHPLAGSSAFGAGISASVPNATGATEYSIVFDEVYYQIGTDYNPATGFYTAPHAGLYSFSATVGIDDVALEMNAGICSFAVTGTGPSVGRWAIIRNNPYATEDGSSGVWRFNGSTTVYLNAGDTVNVIVALFNQSVVTANTATLFVGTGGPPARTWFTGYNVT